MVELICHGEKEVCVSGRLCMFGLRVVPFHFILLYILLISKSLVQQANDMSNDSIPVMNEQKKTERTSPSKRNRG